MSRAPYPSALLNEIHTYFPALLYDSERFETVPHLMNYVNTQMRRNFDIFSNNREAYLSQEYPPTHTTPIRQTRRRHDISPPPTPQRRQRQRTHDQPSVVALPPEIDNEDDNVFLENSALNPILTQLLTNLITQPANLTMQPSLINSRYTYPVNITTWLEPISVRPSAEILNTNTTISVIETVMDVPCIICQDSMEQGATVRKITECGHVFHRTCIDTWFQSHVHCPTCRHDVRQELRTTTPLNTNRA
jgi:hypothetical protein